MIEEMVNMVFPFEKVWWTACRDEESILYFQITMKESLKR